MLMIAVIVAPAYAGGNGTSGDENAVFRDVTKQAGVDYNRISYSQCWGDIDGDGLIDIFIVNHFTVPALFKNMGDGTFRDITSWSGTRRGGDRHGCAVADYDNDGDKDIYVSVGANKGKGKGLNMLYRNNGKGRFVNVASAAGVTDPKGRGRSVSWVDYDNDGLLDLFVANDRRADAPSALFRNNGDGSFTDVSEEAGLKIVGRMAEASWMDYDNDGFMDLTASFYKKHLKGEINIYRNSGSGSFRKVRTFAGRSYAWGDYDNDGDMDILIINRPRHHISRYEIGFLPYIFRGSIRLYENKGGGEFEDVSESAGLEGSMGGHKGVFFDYDNDGDLDIYLVVSGTKGNNINDMVFRNNGDRTFTDVTLQIGLVQDGLGGRGYAAAYADYNGDGFPDIFLTNGKQFFADSSPAEAEGPYVLYENTGGANHWLKIRLRGTKSNRDGIGARIRLYTGKDMQYRQSTGGMQGYVQNTNIIHFGLGGHTRADRIEIKWPGGSVSVLDNVAADQLISVREE